jgi:carboxyl-terminal processing protease
VLVDVTTVSAGEAIPYLLKGLPGTAVIGWHATQGSFGIGEKSIVLPAGLRVLFPHAQSLDAAGAIEVDADAAGKGGVEPDHRLPLTEDSVRRWLGHGEDLPLEEAIRFIRGGE